ncbi:chemoreceptor glutamine deamidase CheD [Novilysobacter spongiicola]|uniref:Probable chemoreceptor glutamine deamidase CheD n=1 Tax=Lysobacter spongiicola DSM 21749 TaxID=1122188 RepID=A0A1T4RSK8_9GAMM|nr:chemoreceptor glutamine deamidase CheD [Lysobacter spongiicola]SKA18932.1 chemotaxis protein CheD [Lysobacter spongiicola DSM 21749]
MNAVTAPAEPGLYYDSVLQTPAIRLLPAEYRVSAEPLALVTLLGSCVAACIYDPMLGIGGMNHFMLPGTSDNTRSPSGVPDISARYGAHAMELVINDLLKRGARRSRLQAKVFGGGNVLSGFHTDPIGTRNARFVLEYLSAEGIQVVAQDLGDTQPRKVCFFVQSGRTLVRRLPSTRDDEIVRAERAYYGTLTREPVSGGVELF